MFKILDQNGIDNENIDGGAFNNFAAGNRDGILKGVLNECSLVAEGNSISIGTGVIILQGIRVKITDPEIISVSSVPYESVRYQIVAQIIMTEGNMTCSFFLRTPSELVKDNFYNSGKGNGTYQQELGRVTHGTNGALTDIQRTLDIISGGGGTGTQAIEIGNVSTNMIDAGLPAEVDVDTRVEGEKEVIDFKFSFPESSAKTIYTVKNLTVKETNNRQFLSDVFLPEGEIENSDTVCLQGLDISSLSPELQNYVNSIEDSGIIYLNRVSPKAFFAVLGAVARPDLYEVNNSGAFSLYLVGNEYGQYQLFGTVISDQSGSAVSAVFDNAGNPLVYKYVKPDTGIPKSDLESSVQTSLSKADSALQSIPIATPSVVGGVKPVTKTSEMTQEVGVDSNGALWTKEASEGTTVVANPTATGTQDLTSLQVGGTVYNIPSSSVEYATNEEIDALFASTPSIPSFADATWEQIAQVAEAGTASNYFAVGDEKTIALSTNEQITLVILGFNHDDLASGGKAGITIGMKNLLATRYAMNLSNTNAGGWDQSKMRTETMQTLLAQLPSDLRNSIKQVNKKATAGGASTTITTSSDKLFLFSEVEIDGTTSAEYADEGEQYEYWKTIKDGTVAADRIKYLSNGGGSASHWWLRSPSVSGSSDFRWVSSTGGVGYLYASLTYGVSFGFCV